MSSTNKTTNYELSQFVGSDKPAWLGDYNSDMLKIDTAVHNVASTATGADGKADANATSIGTLTNLTTTAKTSLVAAINEVDSNADTAQGTATTAGTTANEAKGIANSLKAYLSITQNGQITPSITNGTASPTMNQLYYALNADGTLGKIYGRLRITVTSAGDVTVTLPVSGLGVSSQFTIEGACFLINKGSQEPYFSTLNSRSMTVNTNGNCVVTLPNLGAGDTATLWFPPCLYFFTDFGDLPD